MPWIPDDEDWLRFLKVAVQADIGTRLMLALAYDCALSRENSLRLPQVISIRPGVCSLFVLKTLKTALIGWCLIHR